MTGTLTPDAERAKSGTTPAPPGTAPQDKPNAPVARAALVAIPVVMVLAFLLAVWNSEWARDTASRFLTFLPVTLYVLLAVATAVAVVRRARPDWTSGIEARLRPGLRKV